jgi:hypothetical protein
MFEQIRIAAAGNITGQRSTRSAYILLLRDIVVEGDESWVANAFWVNKSECFA